MSIRLINSFTKISLDEFYHIFPEITLSQEEYSDLQNRPLPKRQTKNAAAYDLSLPYGIFISPNSKVRLFFGWELELKDENVQCILLPRSSLAKKKGLLLTDTYKVFYSGEKIIAEFENFTDEPVVIERDERIAQLCFSDTFLFPKEHHFSGIRKVKYSKVDYNIDSSERTKFAFEALEDTELIPGRVSVIMTGLKCQLKPTEVLFLNDYFNFKSLNSKIILANGIGVVDSDYYDNESNEGEIGFLLLNRGYVPFQIKKGTILGEGWISNYFTIEGDEEGGKRVGGFGSTK